MLPAPVEWHSMDGVEFEHMKTRMNIGPAHAKRLREMEPALAPHLSDIVDRFYDRLLADPQAREIITRESKVEHLRIVLKDWMSELFDGVYEQAYFERRSRIGKAHVRVGLPERFMVIGMAIIRDELAKVIQQIRPADETEDLSTLNKLLDLELAIMLEAYRESYVAKIRAADKRAMQRQLQEVKHMASIGQLAASLAHEIKNPIAGISGAIQIISQGMDRSDPHYEIMREILRQIDRLDSAVKDLLIYARPKPPERRECDVGVAIRSCLALLNEDPTVKSMRIEDQGLDRGIKLMLDEAQFSQVVSNLFLNAAQACRGRGTIRISIETRDDDVVVTVADDGPGMSRDTARRALEPFFTTKARGTGLGLPICKRIIEAHQGTLSIETRTGRGTTIKIRLPGSSGGGRPKERQT